MFLGPSFPCFHHFDPKTSVAASVESFDTTAPAWRTRFGLARKLESCVDGLAAFNGAMTDQGVQIATTDVKARMLRIAIPDVRLSQWQIDALDAAKAHAATKTIQIEVIVVK